ncbi:YtcA family lipoprotein [Stappia stellulata]|uniref:YtcA family lipoprotein n=1 Tax=Stappia stellulata TaxID=71235 RepID=UPI0009FD45CE|nr:YtcA family lipoprotein [Stappia stellulata]
MPWTATRSRACAAVSGLFLPALSATSAAAAAPSVPMFGSYFPSWLLSFGAAVGLTVIARILFVTVGLEDILRWRGALYLCLVAGLSALIDTLVI